MYKFLDYFFLIFHTLLILFNLFGWIWKKTRKLNLITLALTGLSWFGLGIFYGWGYCPFTDWHWDILKAMDLNVKVPNSYITYLVERLTGVLLSNQFVEWGTLGFYLFALFVSVYVNFFQKRLKINK